MGIISNQGKKQHNFEISKNVVAGDRTHDEYNFPFGGTLPREKVVSFHDVIC